MFFDGAEEKGNSPSQMVMHVGWVFNIKEFSQVKTSMKNGRQESTPKLPVAVHLPEKQDDQSSKIDFYGVYQMTKC